MKKLLIGLSMTALLFLTACGGKENTPPPPVDLGCGGGGEFGGGEIGGGGVAVGVAVPAAGSSCGNADDAASYALLQQQVKQALDQCAANVRMFAVITAQQMYQQPNVSVQQSQVYQQQLQQPQTSQENACTTATNNFLLNLSTMKNGQYIQRPDVQEWLRLAFFAPLGDRAVQGFPPQQLLDPNFRNGLMTAGTQYFERMSTFLDPKYRSVTTTASTFLTQFK